MSMPWMINSHRTLLIGALAGDHWDDVHEFLLTREDEDVNGRDNYGRTPLICACPWGHLDVVCDN